MIWLLLFAALVPFAAAAQGTACQPVQSDWIQGGDLAHAIPAFAALPPDLRIGFAPLPGHARVFEPGELMRIARANHVDASISERACFAWRMDVPNRVDILGAMSDALAGRNPNIEIVEQSLFPAPSGKLVFPLSGLSAYSDAPAVWRGYVEYAAQKHFDIWARVRISVREDRVVAAAPLRAGECITAEQLRLESYSGPPTRDLPLKKLRDAAGMVPRMNVAVGAPLSAAMLAARAEVERGDLVAVVVESGAALVEAQGVAEQTGRRGDVITVRNVLSARRFRAQIEGAGRVVVVPGGPFGLVGDETKNEMLDIRSSNLPVERRRRSGDEEGQEGRPSAEVRVGSLY